MRIQEIHLEAFGCYTDFWVHLSESGRSFHILYGGNEAGKSTLLRALTNLLYGIPANTPDAFHHLPSRLRIGGTIADSRGKRLTFYRRKGNKNTLTNSAKEPLEDSVLEEFLGGISRQAFTTMFGLDHESLRQGGESLLKSGGNVGESLFEAAMGVHHLNQVISELDRNAGLLFKPSGSKPVINQLIQDYKNLKAKISASSLSDHYWTTLKQKLAQHEHQLHTLMAKIRQQEKEKHRLERVNRSLPLIAKRKSILVDMANMGEVAILPEDFSEKCISLSQQLAMSRADQKRVEEELKELEEKLDSLHIPQALLDHASTIQALHEQLPLYRNHQLEIPEIIAENRLLEQDIREKLSQLPFDGTIEQAEKLRIPLFDKERIGHLVSAYHVLEEKRLAAEKNVREREDELQFATAKLHQLGTPSDTSALEQMVAEVRKLGDIEERTDQDRASCRDLEERILLEIEQDPIWSGSIEEAERMAVPLLETVELYHEQYHHLQGERKQIREKVREIKERQKSIIQQQEEITRKGQVPGEEDLKRARQRREQGWHLVLRSWLEQDLDAELEKRFSPDKPLHKAYEEAVVQADQMADQLRLEADRIAHYEQLTQLNRDVSDDLKQWEANQAAIDEDLNAWKIHWNRLWNPIGITPLSTKEMKEWLGRHAQRMSLIRDWRQLKGRIQENQEKIEALIKRLNSILAPYGLPGYPEQVTLSSLLSWSENFIKSNSRLSMGLDTAKLAVQEAARKANIAKEERNAVIARLEAWKQEWAAAIRKTGMSESLGAEQAGRYIQIHDELFAQIDQWKRNAVQLQKKQEAAACFEQEVTRLIVEIGWKTQDFHSTQHMINHLYIRSTEALRDQERQREWFATRENKKEEFERIQRSAEELQLAFQGLLAMAKCQEEAQLIEAQKQSQTYLQLQNQLQLVEQQLLELGSGLTIEEMMEEAEQTDRDLLPQSLKEITEELNKLADERSEWDQNYGATKSEFAKLDGQSQEALLDAEEAEQVLARLRHETGQYIRYQLASSILRKAIEQYRKENQNPILKRASEVFSRLTLGSYSGLGVGFDNKDVPILVGIRPTGEEVPIEGMSDGTQDQLYLALRVANVEKYGRENDPMPLILDDILIHFDDDRAKETLRVLAELSKKTQVIYFTHHAHLVGLAKQVIDEDLLDIHRLDHRNPLLEVVETDEAVS